MMEDVWNESEGMRVREDGVGVSKNDVVSGTKLEVKNVRVVLGPRLVDSEMLDCTNVVDGVIATKMGVEDWNVEDKVTVNSGVKGGESVLVISTKEEVGSSISNDDDVSASNVVRDGIKGENDGLGVVIIKLLGSGDASVVVGVTRGVNDGVSAVTEGATIVELEEKNKTVED